MDDQTSLTPADIAAAMARSRPRVMAEVRRDRLRARREARARLARRVLLSVAAVAITFCVAMVLASYV
jgi:hypothetical protein